MNRRARLALPLWLGLLAATLMLSLPAAGASAPTSERSASKATQSLAAATRRLSGKSRRPRLSQSVLGAALESIRARRMPSGLKQRDRKLLRRIVKSLARGNESASRVQWRAFVRRIRGKQRGRLVRAAARWVFYQSVLKPNPRLRRTLERLRTQKARKALILLRKAKIKAALRRKRQARAATPNAASRKTGRVRSVKANSGPSSAFERADVAVAGGYVLPMSDQALVRALEELDREANQVEQEADSLERASAQDVAEIAARNQSIQNTISAASQCVSTAKTIDQKMTGKQTQ